MKILKVLVFLLVSVSFLGCSEESVTPEVTTPSGTVDYFSEAMEFSASAGSKTINFTSNVEWNIVMSDTQGGAGWCKLSQTEGSAGTFGIAVMVDENTSYDDRKVVLILTAGNLTKSIVVSQKQKNAITLTSDRFEIDCAGGTIDIEVSSNVDYHVEIPEQYQGWIIPGSSSRGMLAKNLSFTIAESKEYDKREGKILFTSGDITETIRIYQAGSAILILSQNKFTVGSDGGSISIDISSNFQYDIDMPNEDWITLAPQSRALSSNTLQFDICANTTYNDREAVLVFKDINGDRRESVTIVQRQKDAILLSNNKYEISQDGGLFSIEVNSNVDYTIEIPSWCGEWISQSTATTRVLVQSMPSFIVAVNDQLDKREGEIYFKYNDISDTLKVYQSGGPVLVLSETEYHLEGGATTISVELKSNIDVTVTSSDEWITMVTTRAVSNSTKYFNISANTTGEKRTGSILFASSDGERTAKVIIYQEPVVFVNSLVIKPKESYTHLGDDLYLPVTSSAKFIVTCTPSDASADYEWTTSDPELLSVAGDGSSATIQILGFGSSSIIVTDKYSGMQAEYGVHPYVTGFAWCNTGDYYYNDAPLMTIAIGESDKVCYTTDQGSSIPNLFGDYSDFVFYEPTVVDEPSRITISPEGVITGLKAGVVGIKPTGSIRRSGTNDRLYIQVVEGYEEQEYNDEFSYANTIKKGQGMRFCLSSTNDVDVFKFTRPAKEFDVKVTYEGDNGSSAGGIRILSYSIYNADGQEFGAGNLSFDATGGEYYQGRWLNTEEGYIRFFFKNEYSATYFPNGHFTVEFVAKE